MTVVDMRVVMTVNGGTAPADGSATFTRWAGASSAPVINGDTVVFPKPFTIRFVDGELKEPVDIPATDGRFCYRVAVSVPGMKFRTRYVLVPASGPVDFGDLVDVDPASFAPVEPTPTLVDLIREYGGASPEQIAAAVEAYLAEHPAGVTQEDLEEAIAAVELLPGPAGPSAVSADAGNLAKLGTDNLILVDPADLPSGGGGAAYELRGKTVLSFGVPNGNVALSDINRFSVFPIDTRGLPTVHAITWRAWAVPADTGIVSGVYVLASDGTSLRRIGDGGVVNAAGYVSIALDSPQVLPGVTYLALKKTGTGNPAYAATTSSSVWVPSSASASFSFRTGFKSVWQSGDARGATLVEDSSATGFLDALPPVVGVVLA